jgi:hypothetical protein
MWGLRQAGASSSNSTHMKGLGIKVNTNKGFQESPAHSQDCEHLYSYMVCLLWPMTSICPTRTFSPLPKPCYISKDSLVPCFYCAGPLGSPARRSGERRGWWGAVFHLVFPTVGPWGGCRPLQKRVMAPRPSFAPALSVSGAGTRSPPSQQPWGDTCQDSNRNPIVTVSGAHLGAWYWGIHVQIPSQSR